MNNRTVLDRLRDHRVIVNPIFTNLLSAQLINEESDLLERVEIIGSSLDFEHLIKSYVDELHYKLFEWYEHNLGYEVLAIDMGLIIPDMPKTAKIQAMQYAKYSTDIKSKFDDLITVLRGIEL